MTEPNIKNRQDKHKIRSIRRLIAIACLLIAAVASALIDGRPSGRLSVDFFDVGQGDAALITTPRGETVLIDGGPDSRILRRLGERLLFFRRRIDYVLYTHYHSDHITGLVSVFRRYEVENFLYASGDYSSALLKTLEAAAREAGAAVSPVAGTAALDLGPDCSLRLLNPAVLDASPDENNSLIARLDCAGRIFLFSGDNNENVEKRLLSFVDDSARCDRFVCDLRADVIKASHHGSNTAGSRDFLTAVAPQLMVISVGADNRFGHPHPALMQRAAELGIALKRTDRDGSVRISAP